MVRQLIFAAIFLSGIAGSAFADDEPGQLKRLTRSGSVRASVGDMIDIAVPSNASIASTTMNLKVAVSGSGLASKAYVVFAPPARPVPGAGGELHAFIPAEKEGDATVAVTLVNGKGESGHTLNFKIKVTKR